MPTEHYYRYTYRFGPRETSGIFLGLGMGSILAVFASFFVLTRLLAHGVSGFLLGLVLITATLIAVWVPIADRTTAQWLPVVTVHIVRRVLGYTRYRGGPAAVAKAEGNTILMRSTRWRSGRAANQPAKQRQANGQVAVEESRQPQAEALDLPGELAGLALLTAEVQTMAGPRQVGVIKDRRRATYCIVLASAGGAFQLLTPEEQDARLVSWGESLDGLGNSATGIIRVQVLNTTVPDSGDAQVRRWTEEGGRGTEGTYNSYQMLLEQSRPSTQRHENQVVLMLDPRKARSQVRHLGGGDDGACRYLVQQAMSFVNELQQAGVEVEGALTPRQIAMVLRTAYEPGSRWMLEARGPNTMAPGGAGADEAGPMAADASWNYYRTDDSFHAIYWIAEWPRREVFGTFMQPLVLHTACERTLSVVMEPLAHRQAEDEIGRRETAHGANQSLRGRLGFRQTAKERRERETITRQDEALASGHALYRFLGLIRVSAPSLEALDHACSSVEANARGLKLRRLYGEADAGFAATLPLCRGLRFGIMP